MSHLSVSVCIEKPTIPVWLRVLLHVLTRWQSWFHFFPTAPESSAGTTPAPITSPSSDVTSTAICMKCFLAAFPTRLQNESLRGGKRGKSRSENRRRRGALVFHIRGAAGRKKKKNGPKARIRCRIAKAEGKSTRRAASLASENGATRRGRARLCGGEHREEAQQKGLSQGHFYTHAHGEEHPFLSGCCILSLPYQMIPKMTVHCRVHFAA